jgi:enoyl-[acyl-carrier-protein] reductase (NADH)
MSRTEKVRILAFDPGTANMRLVAITEGNIVTKATHACTEVTTESIRNIERKMVTFGRGLTS